jgi:hypothetical protein
MLRPNPAFIGTHKLRGVTAVAAVIGLCVATACRPESRDDTAQQSPVIAPTSGSMDDSKDVSLPVFQEFTNRVNDYVALQRKLDGTLSKLSDHATPQELDAHERALGVLVAKARPDAAPGSLFSKEMQTAVRQLLARVFSEPKGAELKASVLDENPIGTKVTVNGRYPDDIPLSTMPPEVLRALPPLPEDLEYRFVGDNLVLLDVKSHLIVDYIDHALPA